MQTSSRFATQGDADWNVTQVARYLSLAPEPEAARWVPQW